MSDSKSSKSLDLWPNSKNTNKLCKEVWVHLTLETNPNTSLLWRVNRKQEIKMKQQITWKQSLCPWLRWHALLTLLISYASRIVSKVALISMSYYYYYYYYYYSHNRHYFVRSNSLKLFYGRYYFPRIFCDFHSKWVFEHHSFHLKIN